MDLDETLLQLIGEIYDCTLNPDAWNAVLPRIGALSADRQVACSCMIPCEGA
jgi:hypothetical protein